VKVHEQSKTVDYADYKVGLFNISPFDLYVEGEVVITKLEKKKSSSTSNEGHGGSLGGGLQTVIPTCVLLAKGL